MKLIQLAVILILFPCCEEQPGFSTDQIRVVKVETSDLFQSIKRSLVVTNREGITQDSIPLYLDPGDGCMASLFDNDSVFVLIDCNGNWYSIDKTHGTVRAMGWFWNKDPPSGYAGTYQWNLVDDVFELNKLPKPGKSDLYRYMDPSMIETQY